MTDDRTNRVNAIVNDLCEHLTDSIERVVELADMDVPPEDIVQLFEQRNLKMDPLDQAKIIRFGYALMGQAPRIPDGEEAIRAQLDALFAEAPTPIDGTSAAIPDIAIVLRTFPHPISGVLTKCPSGTLKLGAVAPAERGQAPALLEHFFTYEDVLTIVVRREMKAAPASTIITSH